LKENCKFFCDRLSDYLDGEVGDNECRLIEEHLDVCPPCAILFESLKTTVDLCGKCVCEDIPENLKLRLREFLRVHCNK
jgi:predicted anti-sigma-YlaC factor YlaD